MYLGCTFSAGLCLCGYSDFDSRPIMDICNDVNPKDVIVDIVKENMEDSYRYS